VPSDDTVLADVYVRTDGRGVHYGIGSDIDVVTDGHRQECHSFSELLERRPNDSSAADQTVAADLDVGQIAADNAVGLDDGLAHQHYVL